MSDSPDINENPSPLFKEYMDRLRSDALDSVKIEAKGVYYLLLAHGAGFAGCLATLKDYATVPHLKGIGTFIQLFGLGFITACLAYIFLIAWRSEIISKMNYIKRNPGDLRSREFYSYMICAVISFLLVVAAMAMIMYKLKDL